MNSISVWLLSVVGVILIGVLIEIILPEGEINKYIKGILAIFTVFVIVLPLTKISIEDLNLDNFFGGTNSTEVDNNFIENVNRQKLIEYELMLESTLSTNGYKFVNIEIDADVSNVEIKINAIFVDLSLMVISGENLNINKYDNIIALIQSIVKIQKENILFYG